MIFQPQIIGKALPTLTNPGTAADLLSGKQLIDANGNVLTGDDADPRSADHYTGNCGKDHRRRKIFDGRTDRSGRPGFGSW